IAALGAIPPVQLEIRQVWTSAPDSLGNISADGRFLTFVDVDNGSVAVRDLRTRHDRQLTPKASAHQNPRISPDGTQVVYSWGGSELRVVATDPAAKAGPRT